MASADSVSSACRHEMVSLQLSLVISAECYLICHSFTPNMLSANCLAFITLLQLQRLLEYGHHVNSEIKAFSV